MRIGGIFIALHHGIYYKAFPIQHFYKASNEYTNKTDNLFCRYIQNNRKRLDKFLSV